MSILNRPSDGYFNALLVICRCLLARKRLSRAALLSLCAPPTLDPPREEKVKGHIQHTLNRWSAYGLLVYNKETDEVELSPELPKELRSADRFEASLPGFLRSVVFRPDLNREKTFWENKADQTADFTRATAWLLAQDVYTMPTAGYEKAVSPIESDQFDLMELRPLQNNTRWNGLTSWAAFLGFGRSAGSEFFIDPTMAVREALPQVFGKRNEVSQADFFDALADLIPVVDGGRYRKTVEEAIARKAWSPVDERQASTSLSRALLRLHEGRELELQDRADAKTGKRSLLGRNRRAVRDVSHLVLQGAR